MTYYRFLMKFLKEDSAIGDVARDVKANKDFPKRGSFNAMWRYMFDSNACDNAMNTFVRFYGFYIKGKFEKIQERIND